ncbi:Imm58 family immunity protein [Bordetella genomosp. 5]|uniref:Imm58 family immunity protein n=1 Tax=Bordetella genomosp. 5 TaxID=1395608 RepID=UPI00159583AC|nr:Imm58 family immunity protein [Bordetella genomosp. 5]
MKTKILAVALTLSLCACALFAYLWIDRSITLTYTSASFDLNAAVTRQLKVLLEVAWVGMPEDEVVQKLQAASERLPTKHSFIKKEENVIWFNQVPFTFDDGKLVSVGSH